MTVGFNEPLHFEHTFACWPYTLTHTTVCFLKNVARWVDVYMSTSSGKLLQFSYSYVHGCPGPASMTVGLYEPHHFEHAFCYWPCTLNTHKCWFFQQCSIIDWGLYVNMCSHCVTLFIQSTPKIVQDLHQRLSVSMNPFTMNILFAIDPVLWTVFIKIFLSELQVCLISLLRAKSMFSYGELNSPQLRCLSPSEMTVGFNELLHFEHKFISFSQSSKHL
jgi:hypothetical protein